MSIAITAARWGRALLHFALALVLGSSAGIAAAQADPPGRVGRIADLNGGVSWWDDESGRWAGAERNQPLTGGDRISTDVSGRAELRIGSTVLRLSNSSELEVLRLDDAHMVFQLHRGSVALRVRSRELAAELELITAEARLLPQTAGHYRLDRIDDVTRAGSWRGELRLSDERGTLIASGQRAEIFHDRRRGGADTLRINWITSTQDGFASWVLAEDAGDERTASNRHVSPEMTGAEELDRHGRWDTHPEYGAVWTPLRVDADWAPYRDGRWAWVPPWGWTWVDTTPWGFAPFHYGRWVNWRERWCWVPGAYVARPVFAPALVAWLGAPGWGVTVRIGGPAVGWVPLAPREVYRPHYRATPVYVERINPAPRYRWREAPNALPRGPQRHENESAPRGVTVVTRDWLVRREPVQRGLIDSPPSRGDTAPPWRTMAPPEAPAAPPARQRRPDPERGPAERSAPPERSMGRDPSGPFLPPGQRVPGNPAADGREGNRDERSAGRDERSNGRDGWRDTPRSDWRDSSREGPRDQPRESPREGRREAPRDEPRNTQRGDLPTQLPVQPLTQPLSQPPTQPRIEPPADPRSDLHNDPRDIAREPWRGNMRGEPESRRRRDPPAPERAAGPMPPVPVPVPAPAPPPAPMPAQRPAPPPAAAPAPAPAAVPAAERPRQRERERDREREPRADDERKRRPEATPVARERENQR